MVSSDKLPIVMGGSQLTTEHLRYMLGAIGEQQEILTKLFESASVGDLVIIMSYLVAALESQIPGAYETFLETFQIFRAGYPNLLAQYQSVHPEDNRDFKFIVPDVGGKPKKNPFLEDSLGDAPVIMPGTGSIN